MRRWRDHSCYECSKVNSSDQYQDGTLLFSVGVDAGFGSSTLRSTKPHIMPKLRLGVAEAAQRQERQRPVSGICG